MFHKWNAVTENAILNYARSMDQLGYSVLNLVHPDAMIIANLEKEMLPLIKTRFKGSFGKYVFITILYFKYLIKNIKCFVSINVAICTTKLACV